MKALVLEEYRKLVIRDVEKPKPAENEVLIRVKACSVCGSDVHGYDGSSGRRQPPIIMGHEASGVIEETGSKVGGYSTGDRVTFNSTYYCGDCYYCIRGSQNMCETGRVFGVSSDLYRMNGAMAEYVVVPSHILFRIPQNVSFEQAALVEPTAIALHAVNRAEIKLNDTAVVFGVGTIGLLILKMLRISSVGRIIAVDVDDSKLENAKNNGADVVLNASKCDVTKEIFDLTSQRGADLCFEAVGIPATTIASFLCLKKLGNAVLVGNVSPTIDLPIQKVVLRELKITGSYCCTDEYENSLMLISSGRINVDDLISVRAPLEEGAIWFERLYTQPAGIIKVVLNP